MPIILAKLGAPYGIKGWIKIHSFTDPAENIFTYKNLLIGPTWQPIVIDAYKAHNNSFIIKLKGCDTPEAAKLFTHLELATHELPTLEKDEVYWSDLVGREVFTESGTLLGNIDHLFETGSNDVLVVKGERERYIPYLNNVIVSLANNRVTVNWDPEF